MPELEPVARVDEIPDGGRKSIIIDDVPALLLRIGDAFYCIEDVCTHDGQPLTDGPLVGCEITCPRHGARFDVRTGQAMCMPATEPVATYRVEVRDGIVYVGGPE
jgi:3-phenylpropionate/trans-cinnamate dioxygenase ferredoxin component